MTFLNMLKKDRLVLPRYASKEVERLYSKLRSLGLTKGVKRELVLAALTYKVCLDYNIPYSLDEIAELFGVDKHDLVRRYEKFKHKLGWRFKRLDWERFLLKCMDKLNFNDQKALRICKKLKIADVRVRCAVALTLAGVPVKKAAKVCGVNKSTVYKRLKALKKGSP